MSEIRSRYPFLAMGNLLSGGFLVIAMTRARVEEGRRRAAAPVRPD